MNYFWRTAAMVLVVAGLGACATVPQWQGVGQRDFTSASRHYAVQMPPGWVQLVSRDQSRITLSRNGVMLNRIMIFRDPGEQAFPGTKKAACTDTANSDPAGIASDFIAEAHAAQTLSGFKVLKNEPAIVGGRGGFHIGLESGTPDGVTYRVEAYGACAGGGFYGLVFRAPAIYYFGKDVPTFDAVVASFKITAPGG